MVHGIIRIVDMLQRTLEKQGPQAPRQIPRSAVIGLCVAAVAGGSYALLPEPGPKLRPVALEEKELLAAAQTLTSPPPVAVKDPALGELAALGRALFHDARLSRDGATACATCHVPALQFTDGKPRAVGRETLPHNTPSIVNAGLNTWFHWDGRADSLASQALKPIEDPREHGISRTFVVRHLLQSYGPQYERAFGKPPAALSGVELPEHALPAPTPPKLSLDVATYALSTMGSFPLLSDILAVAQSSRLAPAMELSRRAFLPAPVDPAWHDAWARLPEPVQTGVNEVFANFGRALAQFERGIVALDSPFDRFVRRATHPERRGQPARQFFDASFGEQEWSGFQLFAGTARCILCHNGPNFTDQQFHNIGLAQVDPTVVDAGRAAGVLRVLSDPFNCTKPPFKDDPLVATTESCYELPYLAAENLELVGAFKTPSLRNVDKTAPYMRDGRFEGLDEVLDHYDTLAAKPAMGHREESLQPLELTDEERVALKAFLKALSSPVRDLHAEETISARP
jgi:cytochrome c peroxidase